jgi:hypothetical protein
MLPRRRSERGMRIGDGIGDRGEADRQGVSRVFVCARAYVSVCAAAADAILRGSQVVPKFTAAKTNIRYSSVSLLFCVFPMRERYVFHRPAINIGGKWKIIPILIEWPFNSQ